MVSIFRQKQQVVLGRGASACDLTQLTREFSQGQLVVIDTSKQFMGYLSQVYILTNSEQKTTTLWWKSLQRIRNFGKNLQNTHKQTSKNAGKMFEKKQRKEGQLDQTQNTMRGKFTPTKLGIQPRSQVGIQRRMNKNFTGSVQIW